MYFTGFIFLSRWCTIVRGDIMTEKQLKQLFYLKKEHKQLESQLKRLEREQGKSVQRQRLINLLEIKRSEIYEKQIEIEQFLGSIEDGEIRLIFRLRHVNLLTWREISEEIPYEQDTIRKKHRAYLRNVSEKCRV